MACPQTALPRKAAGSMCDFNKVGSPNLRNADQSIVQIPFIFSFACHPFKIRDIAKHYELGLMNNETWLRWITAVLGSSSLSP